MQAKETKEARGSEKLWSNVFDNESLDSAVAKARGGYTIKRWWKYGQPAIDRIKAVLEVKTPEAGNVIQEILRGNNREVQVSMEVFPLGMPDPEIYRLNVVSERQIHR